MKPESKRRNELRAHNREEYNAYMRDWRKKNKAHYRRSRQRRTCTPTRPIPECCEACGTSFECVTFGACIDHDHKTGVFRGWLCGNCNLALGHLKDDPERIAKLLLYLQQAVLLS